MPDHSMPSPATRALLLCAALVASLPAAAQEVLRGAQSTSQGSHTAQ